jgi:ribosomal protein S2
MTWKVPQGRCIWHVYRRFSIIPFAKTEKMMKSHPKMVMEMVNSHILMESMKMKMGGSEPMLSTLMSVMISTVRIQWCTGRSVNHQTGLKRRMGTLRGRKKPQRMRVLSKMKGSQRTRMRVTSNGQGVTRIFLLLLLIDESIS